MGWQPIETAPKDRDILVYIPDADDPIDIVCWANYRPRGFFWAHARCADGSHVSYEPTHWQPLPEAPDAATLSNVRPMITGEQLREISRELLRSATPSLMAEEYCNAGEQTCTSTQN